MVELLNDLKLTYKVRKQMSEALGTDEAPAETALAEYFDGDCDHCGEHGHRKSD